MRSSCLAQLPELTHRLLPLHAAITDGFLVLVICLQFIVSLSGWVSAEQEQKRLGREQMSVSQKSPFVVQILQLCNNQNFIVSLRHSLLCYVFGSCAYYICAPLKSPAFLEAFRDANRSYNVALLVMSSSLSHFCCILHWHLWKSAELAITSPFLPYTHWWTDNYHSFTW